MSNFRNLKNITVLKRENGFTTFMLGPGKGKPGYHDNRLPFFKELLPNEVFEAVVTNHADNVFFFVPLQWFEEIILDSERDFVVIYKIIENLNTHLKETLLEKLQWVVNIDNFVYERDVRLLASLLGSSTDGGDPEICLNIEFMELMLRLYTIYRRRKRKLLRELGEIA